jgi:uncharacterized protein (DUF1501 family)
MARWSWTKRDELTRRDFLASAAAAWLGVGLLPSLFASEPPAPRVARRPTAKHLIYLYMSGGMSHLDTFDPKPGRAEQGPVKAIATSADGVQISEYFPLLAKRMHQCAVIRSMNSNQGAHEQGNYFMHTSYQMRGTVRHPALGAWLLALSKPVNRTIPGNVIIGGPSNYPGAGYLDPTVAPLAIGKASEGLAHSALPRQVQEADFANRMTILRSMNKRFHHAYHLTDVHKHADAYEQAVKLMKSDDLKAFDISAEDKDTRDRYGDAPFAQGCLLARRLVEHGVRYVEVDLGGWDTHTDNFDRVADQAEILDRSLATLISELSERGILEETLVVLGTEFGRTPEIVENDGRNHHPKAFSCLMAGGGVRGGYVHGGTDEIGASVASGKVVVPDFNASIGYALGLSLDQVVTSPSGRPFTFADKGRPVLELFA